MDPKPVRTQLKGTWIYSYSIAGKERKQIQGDNHCPVYRMTFSECNDSKEMKKINSPVVQNLRKANVLKDLKCITYDSSGKLIDTYFPVLHFAGSDSLIEMQNYGYRYKNEYYVDVLSGDSMVIHDNKIYALEDKPCYDAKHIYYRKK